MLIRVMLGWAILLLLSGCVYDLGAPSIPYQRPTNPFSEQKVVITRSRETNSQIPVPYPAQVNRVVTVKELIVPTVKPLAVR